MENSSRSIRDVPTPGRLFGDLMLTRLAVRVSLEKKTSLPPHSGSTWRGLLGWRVMSLVCPFDRRPACTACIIRDNCPYFILMEKESPLSGLSEAPKGYVISPDPPDPEGRQTVFVTLIGRCARLLPVVIQALLTGGARGIGAERSPYRVEAVEEIAPDGRSHPLYFSDEGLIDARGPWPLTRWLGDTPATVAPLELRLVTPVRLRRKGRYAAEMDWRFYLGTLARRLEGLNRVFNDGPPLGKPVWLALNEHFNLNGAVHTDVRWKDMARYSSRQRRKVPMGGMVGRAFLASSPPWLTQWWKAAELVHVGKGAAMGWGKVVVA